MKQKTNCISKWFSKENPKDKLERAFIVLTEEQRSEIIESKKEIGQGLYIEHALLD